MLHSIGSFGLTVLLTISMLSATTANAQERGRTPREAQVRRVRIPPVVDGKLDDRVWSEAPVIDDLYQVEPVEGAVPSQRTEVRLVYDDDALYVGVLCYDTDPGGIVATQRVRDADLEPDDRIELILDTFRDRRNAYFFQISPGGSIGDALFSNAEGFNKRWDGIWWGEAAIGPEGWSAELWIPFKTLSFDPDAESWGFNFARVVKRNEERIRWSNPSQDSGFFRIAEAGTLQGFANLQQGLGLDLVPFALGKIVRDTREGREIYRGEVGGDAFYRLTPSLQASLTINTDFAETEVDERQVNLTRFPLFFPERRDFFLQDASIFSFGGLRQTPLPFFSRRIGLVNGEEVPILAGAKLTGRAGDYNIGVIDVQTDADGELDSKNLFVTRVSKNVLEESQIGVIATRGRPGQNGENALAGVDFTYRTSELFGDRNFQVDVWGMGTHTSGRGGDGGATGLAVDFPNDDLNTGFEATWIGEDFNPELGFVSRRGNIYDIDLEYRPRPGTWIRQLSFGFFPYWATKPNHELESRRLSFVPFEAELESGDRLELRATQFTEWLDEGFEIRKDIVIPPGSHDYTRYSADLRSGTKRPVSVQLRVEGGTFWTGRRTDIEAGIEWRTGPFLTLAFEQEENHVHLEEGNFITRIVRGRWDLAFDPRLTWRSFLQFDNVSNEIGLNSRVRWIIEPGSELFVVLNQGWERDGHEIAPFRTELTTKLVWTLRF